MQLDIQNIFSRGLGVAVRDDCDLCPMTPILKFRWPRIRTMPADFHRVPRPASSQRGAHERRELAARDARRRARVAMYSSVGGDIWRRGVLDPDRVVRDPGVTRQTRSTGASFARWGDGLVRVSPWLSDRVMCRCDFARDAATRKLSLPVSDWNALTPQRCTASNSRPLAAWIVETATASSPVDEGKTRWKCVSWSSEPILLMRSASLPRRFMLLSSCS